VQLNFVPVLFKLLSWNSVEWKHSVIVFYTYWISSSGLYWAFLLCFNLELAATKKHLSLFLSYYKTTRILPANFMYLHCLDSAASRRSFLCYKISHAYLLLTFVWFNLVLVWENFKALGQRILNKIFARQKLLLYQCQ